MGVDENQVRRFFEFLNPIRGIEREALGASRDRFSRLRESHQGN